MMPRHREVGFEAIAVNMWEDAGLEPTVAHALARLVAWCGLELWLVPHGAIPGTAVLAAGRILVQGGQLPADCRWGVAHELAEHIALHVGVNYFANEIAESHANRLGRAILLPAPVVRANREKAADELAVCFCVPKWLAAVRLFDLTLVEAGPYSRRQSPAPQVLAAASPG